MEHEALNPVQLVQVAPTPKPIDLGAGTPKC
jgi:hypothetical protein